MTNTEALRHWVFFVFYSLIPRKNGAGSGHYNHPTCVSNILAMDVSCVYNLSGLFFFAINSVNAIVNIPNTIYKTAK